MNNLKNQRYKYLILTLVTGLVILIITAKVIKSMTQATFPQITFLGEVNFPRGLKFKNTEVGRIWEVWEVWEVYVFYFLVVNR